MKKISTVIREARKKKGYTLNTLARNTGISISFLCDIEHERKKPSLKTMVKLSEILDISLDKELLAGEVK